MVVLGPAAANSRMNRRDSRPRKFQGPAVYNFPVSPLNLRPMRLSRRPEPFDSDDYLYELKIDGFRALAHVGDGKGQLISRNGRVFKGFAELANWIAEHLKV